MISWDTQNTFSCYFILEDVYALLEIPGLNPGSVISYSLYMGKSIDLLLSHFGDYLVWLLFHLIYVNNIELCPAFCEPQ